MYADDILLLAPSITYLEKLLGYMYANMKLSRLDI